MLVLGETDESCVLKRDVWIALGEGGEGACFGLSSDNDALGSKVEMRSFVREVEIMDQESGVSKRVWMDLALGLEKKKKKKKEKEDDGAEVLCDFCVVC